jgi:general stress protein YciG
MAGERAKSNRGFAAMDPAKQREIARKGGESVPHEKRSFSQNHELAAKAGRKGGQSVPDEKRSFSRSRELAAEAGRKGGQASDGGRGTKATGRPESREAELPTSGRG